MERDARLDGLSATSLNDYAELQRRWKALRPGDVAVREVACVGAPRTLLAAEIGDQRLPCVAIAAGVHGDEPAAVWALLSIVEDGLLDARLSYRLGPCTNPTGLVAGTRANGDGKDVNRSFSRGGTSPEARAVVTANRDRRFILSLDLHEDPEAAGFYCYEECGQLEIGPRIIAALDDAGLAVQDLQGDFDLGYPACSEHLRRLERGRVITDYGAEAKVFAGLPYNVYMRRSAQAVMTLESAGTHAPGRRVAMHRIAVVTAIAALLKVLPQGEPKQRKRTPR
ncbi:MAG: hypothetical protein NVS1B14_01230 [Vulcanimicrobiaceae bacterium]